MPSQKVAIIEVSLPMLAQFLRLPSNVNFLKVRQTWEQERAGKFEILVEAPNLQEVHPGNAFPWGKCVMHMEFCKSDEILHIARSEVENY